MKYYRSAGTTQTGRLTSFGSIDPVLIDATTQTDFLNFVSDFAGLLQYWNGQGNIDGDWKPFFDSDTSFVLADISRFELSPFQKKVNLLKKSFENTNDPAEREKVLVDLYLQLLSLASSIGTWYQRLSSSHNTDQAICENFLNITQANLDSRLGQLIPIFNVLTRIADTNPNVIAKRDVSHSTTHTAHLMPALLHRTDEQEAYPGNGQDTSLFSFWQCYYQILQSLLKVASQLLLTASSSLENSLQNPGHSPQVSLLLAFYQMLQPAKESLNSLSAQHQQFYFERILQQKPQSYTPDHTFLTFTAAPDSDIDLPKGTQFEAGTNASTGALITYTSNKECPVSQATPTTYKALYNGTTSDVLTEAIQGKVLASPVANSQDGAGKKITFI